MLDPNELTGKLYIAAAARSSYNGERNSREGIAKSFKDNCTTKLRKYTFAINDQVQLYNPNLVYDAHHVI